MDLASPKDSPDKPDLRPSFRKPSSDAVNRKYRHHSPADGSESSSLGGSPKHEQSISPRNSFANRNKASDERVGKYHEPEKDPDRSHSSRGGDTKSSDRLAYRNSRDYQHSDDGGYLRHDEERDSARYSKHDRELRSVRLDCAKHKENYERSKETNRIADKIVDRYHSRDRYEDSGHRSRGKDREINVPDHRYSEKESSRAASRRDHKRIDERGLLRERDDKDDKRVHHRSPSDYRKGNASPEDRAVVKDSFIEREGASHRQKESHRKESGEQDYQVPKRRYNDQDIRKYDKYSLDPENRKKGSDSFSVYQGRVDKSGNYDDKNCNTTEESSSSKKSKSVHADKFPLNMAEAKPSSSSTLIKEATEKFTLGLTSSANNHTEAAQDLNAAKVAAMKAAELVNRNLTAAVPTGYMSTDQKKKLLWGNKKNTSEEPSNRWDLQLFTDRERQEKFNKLMGVKGDTIPQERPPPDEKDAERQKELQIDLEKQYTAGLRRRDGRTVGLGL